MGRLAERAGKATLCACIFVMVCVTAAVLSGCAERYTVSFDANGGISAPAQIENVISGSKIGAPIFNLERENYTFDGKWYKEKECTEEWRFDTDTVRGDLTLFAGWSSPGADINSDGGSEDNNENKEGGDNTDEDNIDEDNAGNENTGGDDTGNENTGSETDELSLLKAGLAEELFRFESKCAVEWFGENYGDLLSGIADAGAININSAADPEAAQRQFEAACAEILHALKSHTALIIEEYFTGVSSGYESGSAQAELLKEYSAGHLRNLESAVGVDGIIEAYEEYLLCLTVLKCDLAVAGYIAELTEIVQILGECYIVVDDINVYTDIMRSAKTADEAALFFAGICAEFDENANGDFLMVISSYYDSLLLDKFFNLVEVNIAKGQELFEIYSEANVNLCSAGSFNEIKTIYSDAAAKMEGCL